MSKHHAAYKTNSIALPRPNYAVAYLLFGALSLMLLGLYIIGINELTKNSFVVKDYTQELKRLTKENRSLQISFTEGNFLGEIENKAQKLHFEKTSDIKYIQFADNSVAKLERK